MNLRQSVIGPAATAIVLLHLGVADAQAQRPKAVDGPPAAPVSPDAIARPVARAARTTAPPRIDGEVDEETWSTAQVLTGFIQAKPRTGYPASERTEVRLLYDDERLYVAALCFDSQPNALVTPSLEQDFQSQDSDVFGISIDPFLDRRNGYMFMVNPHGALKDVQLFDDSRSENGAWEGPVQVRARIHDWGWSVEMAIPFATVRFDPNRDPQTWGLNFLRRIRRRNEDSFWAPLPQRDQIHKMSKAGTLASLEGIHAGRNFSLKPYALAGTSTGSALPAGLGGRQFDAGADAKFGVTPGLTLDLTWRTDFSQVEVDQEQVNLTRFSLFFPEKRDFFVENSGTFAFGDELTRGYRTGSSLQDFTLFHSRRIGLTATGQPIPILGGGRLTGKAGGFELGALNMQTRSSGNTPAENFTVLRARMRVLANSDVGAMFVNRQSTGSSLGDPRRDYGMDGTFRFGRSLIAQSYVARTEGTGKKGSDVAARVAAGWRDALWDVSAFVKQVGEAFDPSTGFVQRTGVRHNYATVGIHPRPDIPFVQELNPFVEAHYITDLHSTLQTRETTLGLGATMNDGGSFSVERAERFERLQTPFKVQSATIPAGDYEISENTASYSSSRGRRLSASLAVADGGYYGGTRTSVTTGMLWRADYHFSLELTGNHNRISLPASEFTADVYRARVAYGLSTTFLTSAFLQYNDAAKQLVTNLRLDFIHAPLSDLFVAFTERRDTRNHAVLERGLNVKFTRYFAF